jgi:hypothetical protein
MTLSGGVTDITGSVNVPAGAYLVQFLGYERQTVDVPATERVEMRRGAYEIDEVEVVYERKPATPWLAFGLLAAALLADQ